MNRRTFLTSTAAVTGGLVSSRAAVAEKEKSGTMEPLPKGAFTDAVVRLSFQPDRLEGTFDEQLARIAELGVPGYETLRPKGDPQEVRRKTDALGLELSCMVGAGAIAPGGMVKTEDHERIVEDFKKNVETAKVLGCKRLVGLSGNERADIPREEQTRNVIACLKRLALIAEESNVTLVMEALNPLVDHKGYFLTRTDQTLEILKAVGSPNVKMLFDIYHQQITEGNVIRNFRDNIDYIGHFHVADNPGRHEPGTGELNYRNIFKAISETKYDGFVAMEFSPLHGKEQAIRAIWECAKPLPPTALKRA